MAFSSLFGRWHHRRQLPFVLWYSLYSIVFYLTYCRSCVMMSATQILRTLHGIVQGLNGEGRTAPRERLDRSVIETHRPRVGHARLEVTDDTHT